MKIRKLNVQRACLVVLSASVALGLTGCGKKSDCEIQKYHLHKYEKEGIVTYLPIENLSYRGFHWTEEVVYENPEEKDLHEFEKKKGLLSIHENEEYLRQQQENNQDFIEYRYAYTYLQPIPHIVRSGRVTTTHFTYIPVTHHSWTKNPNHTRLTGETRVCHYVYEACKIEKNEKGKYVVVKSPKVDDIFTIQEEYPYFTEKSTKITGIYDGLELDYENGATDQEKNILSEEEAKQYEEGKEYTKRR